MATNSDGTVVVKTPGKLAAVPKTSGDTGITKPTTARSTASGPKIVPTKGRGPVARSAQAH